MPEKKFGRFLIVWIGQIISNIGSGLTAFSLGIYAFQKTQSALCYSLIILLAFLPSFLLKPIGGTLADRVNRKLLMITGDFGSALGLVFILIMMYSGTDDMWVIYAGVSFSSVFIAVHEPAYRAMITDLLDEKFYSKAGGLMQLSESSRFLISPIVAALLLTFMDVKNILMIDIASFAVAIAFVFLIKGNFGKSKSDIERKGFFIDLKEGFNYITSNKGILWLLFLSSVITFAIGFLEPLLGPMILSFSDSKALGIILTTSSSGMLLMSIYISVFGKLKKFLNILFYFMILCGIFYTLLGVSTNEVFLMFAGFLFFCTLPFINTSFDVLIRKNVDNEIQGRVWAMVSLVSQFGMVIAYSISGLLADYVFNPLLNDGGILVSTVGKIIGSGRGRGIGLMFVLFGFVVSAMGVVIKRVKILKSLEKE
ncbi:MAG: MFS transporter [Ignavibacteria bacterium]|jgi:MFS family permease